MALSMEQALDKAISQETAHKEYTRLAMKAWRNHAPIRLNGESMVNLRKRIAAHWINRPDTGEKVEVSYSASRLMCALDGIVVFDA